MATATKTIKQKTTPKQSSLNGLSSSLSERIPVQKTYKLYIGGKYPRTESARYYQVFSNNKLVANVGRSSRKDFRNAVKIARATFSTDWAKRAPFNRGHIMYRIAEMLEYRKYQFIDELVQLGQTKQQAEKEVFASIDRLIYYAGWSDKYHQVFGSVNPTNTSHFNFSVYEPMGVVAIIAPEEPGLLGLISTIVPVILGGNTCIIIPAEKYGTIGISLSEVLHTSDVSGGAVNILTGFEKELAPHTATHMDVNAVIYCGKNEELATKLQQDSSSNLKRFFHWKIKDWYSEKAQNPYLILDTQEVKTTWHPIGF
jgi:acyl-CoA reductase-like NAD-dependent aldehyde dehydrogenase